tara:strand:- start:20 stop:703 length:684 start_codon:yes stop_codon:yes gene_type:complete
MTYKILKNFRIGQSSEIYNVEINDILSLEDTNEVHIKNKNQITVLISANGDKLASGRSLAQKALQEGNTHIPVKFIFQMRYPIWKLHITLIKRLRDKKRVKGTNIYHIIPQEIRDLGIERAYRTTENAHQHSAALEHRDNANLFTQLTESIVNNGYDDKYPMDVQLCRSFGVQDTLNQGHHRMGVLIEHNIQRASIRLSAVGYIPNPFRWFLLKAAKAELKNKRNKS